MIILGKLHASTIIITDYIANNNIGETIDIYSESLFEMTAIAICLRLFFNE